MQRQWVQRQARIPHDDVTDLHHIFYGGDPSGKAVSLLLGTLSSVGFTREETGLEIKVHQWKLKKMDKSKHWNVFLFSTYRYDDGHAQLFPVLDILRFSLDLYMLNKFV